MLGITGSIASGKTTVAALFADAGVPVLNADAVVHSIYAEQPELIAGAFPAAMIGGQVDRERLAAFIEHDPPAIARLESIVHPIVRERAVAFLANQRDGLLAVLEIPLLFESGINQLCDRVLVTIAPAELRGARVSDRGTMSPSFYRQLMARHMSDAERQGRADYVVDSSTDMDEIKREVGNIIASLETAAKG